MVDVAVSSDNTVTSMLLRTYAYVLEAKVTVFSCLTIGIRFSFFSSYALATVVRTSRQLPLGRHH